MAPVWLSQLHDLLGQPDEPFMRRGHQITHTGKWDRRSSVLLPLLTRWAQHHYIAKDAPAIPGKARKAAKGFRLIIADRRRRA